MKIFIINLNSAPGRYLETFTALLDGTGVDAEDVHRFDAEGADYEAERVTSVCRSLCPSKTLGCALSHRAVADEALRGDISKSFPILVLEDDSFPARPQSLLRDLEKEAARSHEWDIILLNTINVIYKPTIGTSSSALSGSTAAYLLSESGAVKLRNCTIPWHADLMRNSYNFSVIQGPELFKTRDLTPTGITFGGRDIVWFARQPYIRIPTSSVRNYDLSCGSVFVIILFLIVVFLWSVSNTRGSIAKLLSANLSGMILAATTAWVWYVTQDSNYAKLSPPTARIAAVWAALSVILASRTLWEGCGGEGNMCVAQLPALVLFGGYASIITLLLWRDEELCRHHLPPPPSSFPHRTIVF
jgi:hypothetical protein